MISFTTNNRLYIQYYHFHSVSYKKRRKKTSYLQIMKQIAQKGGWLGVWVVAGVVWTKPKRTFFGEKDLPKVPREHLDKWNNAPTFPIRLSDERARISRQNPRREPQAITSPAAPLQPDEERNSRSDQDVCLFQERQEAISLTVLMTSPRNIGIQCENIDLESGSENGTVKKGLCLTESLKKYFGLGVQVSDPLLNAAKWIAYITEVKLEIFLLIKKVFPFKDWCHRYSGYGPVHIFLGCQYIHQSITEIAPGPISWVVLHFLHRLHLRHRHHWPDGLLLLAPFVGQTVQAPACGSATGNQPLFPINITRTIVIWSSPALSSWVPTLDPDHIHPLSADHLALLHPQNQELLLLS